jgi:hypothetical protein
MAHAGHQFAQARTSRRSQDVAGMAQAVEQEDAQD